MALTDRYQCALGADLKSLREKEGPVVQRGPVLLQTLLHSWGGGFLGSRVLTPTRFQALVTDPSSDYTTCGQCGRSQQHSSAPVCNRVVLMFWHVIGVRVPRCPARSP